MQGPACLLLASLHASTASVIPPTSSRQPQPQKPTYTPRTQVPELGKKALFVCVPTTSGTGSEVTPFAVVTDEATGIKYPLADYALTPHMVRPRCRQRWGGAWFAMARAMRVRHG